ncbi:hypothetical protein PV721_39945 [Streptomyces sp. MB09-01]|uniref:hypothetical protein n=1 Tax=Streptomyces sp. MB09-01 TaxID=3028666 RepID=UPI0029AA945A|nr:hypothetical protein [Streptomyces sp. MB09-01]MDX3540374.1 hypothetical protein [Streptomyces sp. MB09-01]
MARTSRKQRFSMFAVSAVMVGGGVLLPTSAFAAPATPQVSEAATLVADHAKSGHESKGKKDKGGHKGKKHGKKNQGKKHGKIKDVKNMPGCKFYKGTVYCEHKPEKPAPTTETPKTETPETETPTTETPATETPATETPATETPATETGEAAVEASSATSG